MSEMPLNSGNFNSFPRFFASDAFSNSNSAKSLRHKILFDLSFATLGFCGIAQESRLLFQLLSTISDHDLDGLVFGVNNSTLMHRFSRSTNFAHLQENHALFLQGLVNQQLAKSPLSISRLYRKLYEIFQLAVTRHAKLSRLNSDHFWSALWDILFANSLQAEKFDLGRRVNFALANASVKQLKLRSAFHLPSVCINTNDYRFAIFQEARAVKVKPSTYKIIRHYDLIPLFRPDTVGTSPLQIKAHFRSIERCLHDSIFVAISEHSRQQLIELFPSLNDRTITIPCTLDNTAVVSKHSRREIEQILKNRASSRCANHPIHHFEKWQNEQDMPPYLLMVSTLEPRKNYENAIKAFEQSSLATNPNLCLVIVGNLGWKYSKILKLMKPLIAQGRLYHLEAVMPDELEALYQHAELLFFPSLAEGFGFPPFEAIKAGIPALVSDIPTHRWVYGDVVDYCQPHDLQSMRHRLSKLLSDETNAYRRKLVSKGQQRLRMYDHAVTQKQWIILFNELDRQNTSNEVEKIYLKDLNYQLEDFRTSAVSRAPEEGDLAKFRTCA